MISEMEAPPSVAQAAESPTAPPVESSATGAPVAAEGQNKSAPFSGLVKAEGKTANVADEASNSKDEISFKQEAKLPSEDLPPGEDLPESKEELTDKVKQFIDDFPDISKIKSEPELIKTLLDLDRQAAESTQSDDLAAAEVARKARVQKDIDTIKALGVKVGLWTAEKAMDGLNKVLKETSFDAILKLITFTYNDKDGAGPDKNIKSAEKKGEPVSADQLWQKLKFGPQELVKMMKMAYDEGLKQPRNDLNWKDAETDPEECKKILAALLADIKYDFNTDQKVRWTLIQKGLSLYYSGKGKEDHAFGPDTILRLDYLYSHMDEYFRDTQTKVSNPELVSAPAADAEEES